MVAVATSLAHDGICSPMSTLQHESGPGSYGVVMPTAVLVDLDRVRQAPVALSTAGIGDAVSNLSAVADWELAVADVGEQMDGLAAAMARSAAQAVLHQPGDARSDEFLTILAESLILSGIAMSVAGSSRPASGGDHEIFHAVNQLYPGTASHGELAGVGRAVLHVPARRRRPRGGDLGAAWPGTACPGCRGTWACPTPSSSGRWRSRPETRPGRYTILERLALSEAEIAGRVAEYVARFSG